MTIKRSKKNKKKFNLFSKKGKKLNKRPMSKKALQKRERQINFFKHKRGRRRR